MDEEEFYEKHPSYLKYKKIMMLTSIEMDAIDDTQIDKHHVERIFNNLRNDITAPKAEGFRPYTEQFNKAKKELGLE